MTGNREVAHDLTQDTFPKAYWQSAETGQIVNRDFEPISRAL